MLRPPRAKGNVGIYAAVHRIPDAQMEDSVYCSSVKWNNYQNVCESFIPLNKIISAVMHEVAPQSDYQETKKATLESCTDGFPPYVLLCVCERVFTYI